MAEGRNNSKHVRDGEAMEKDERCQVLVSINEQTSA